MHLSAEDLSNYRRNGFLVYPELFAADEVAAMKNELQRLEKIDTDHVVRERSSGSAKTLYRVHEADGPTASPPFFAAARSPRMLGTAQQLLADPELYIYHTKCNRKAAIDGSIWQWHQDYGTWAHDGTPAPELTTGMVMLDEATEANGCLYFIPGSHRLGLLDAELDDKTTSYKLWVLPKERLIEIMEKNADPVAIVGKPGTVVFFHPTILHGSGHNMSRHDRWQIYYVYNKVANRPINVDSPRPDYVRSTNWNALQLGEDDILGKTPALVD
ncbi:MULTISPECIES: phytanoyl-CoA dioxygenase family protein [Limibacillus]|jgi:ectoine hydroxylase|uniref:Ectoine hydroxylase n=1 Tax=Limibacillus halophilus TaxID=1579333 RepID=A0A839STM4_9PROT|nr:phytanoyl-CoA dioxygenase family protein [Limibacillus halophilus]MBB3064263.1 ectoine hydroxylase [Limibacillus halophilus]